MPKIQCDLCQENIDIKNISRHKQRKHAIFKQKTGPKCDFCGIKQTHIARHFSSCKLTNLKSEFKFIGTDNTYHYGMDDAIRRIIMRIQRNQSFILVGGKNGTGKTQTVKYILKNLPHAWFGCYSSNFKKQMQETTKRIIVLDEYNSKERLEIQDKIIIAITDVPETFQYCDVYALYNQDQVASGLGIEKAMLWWNDMDIRMVKDKLRQMMI